MKFEFMILKCMICEFLYWFQDCERAFEGGTKFEFEKGYHNDSCTAAFMGIF